jgi:hypothetical protein
MKPPSFIFEGVFFSLFKKKRIEIIKNEKILEVINKNNEEAIYA